MTSDTALAVFAYLPDTGEAVPAGVLHLREEGETVRGASFRYGTRYLERRNAVEIDPVSLSIQDRMATQGRDLYPANGLPLFGGIRDAAPDAWGRRVIENKLKVPLNSLPESQYLLHAGPGRAGALDIRAALTDPSPEGGAAPLHHLEYLLQAADRIEQGEPVPARLEEIFVAGSGSGGMRPKANVVDSQGVHWLAKFPSRHDRWLDVPAIEYATLRLAAECGLNTPAVRLENMLNQSVMLIARFDRLVVDGALRRQHLVSALTMLGLHEMERAGYPDIARAQAQYGATGTIASQQAELFGRMIFNIFVSNNDDHLRNHSFLWSGQGWMLSPLYDVVPSPSAGQAFERYLTLGIGAQGRLASLPNAISQHALFGLTHEQAMGIIERIERVTREWRTYFLEWGLSQKTCDTVASAFRHRDAIGWREIVRAAPTKTSMPRHGL